MWRHACNCKVHIDGQMCTEQLKAACPSLRSLKTCEKSAANMGKSSRLWCHDHPFLSRLLLFSTNKTMARWVLVQHVRKHGHAPSDIPWPKIQFGDAYTWAHSSTMCSHCMQTSQVRLRASNQLKLKHCMHIIVVLKLVDADSGSLAEQLRV